MATPKKKKNYTIFYDDGTYMTFELTREDFQKVEDGLTGNNVDVEGRAFAHAFKNFVAVSIGVIGLSNVKAVIEQKEPEQEAEPENAELPPLDQESFNWIKEQLGGF